MGRIWRLFKPNLKLVDDIIGKLDIKLFYGIVGAEIHYYNYELNTYLFTILKKSFFVRILFTGRKHEFLKNIGLTKLNFREKKYLYKKIEEFLKINKLEEDSKIKNNLLYKVGITEEQFAFLVENCKSYYEKEN